MKLLTFERCGNQSVGVWLDEYILVVEAVRSLMDDALGGKLVDRSYTSSMLELLESPVDVMQALSSVVEQISAQIPAHLQDWLDQGILIPSTEAQLLAPLPYPGKVICVAGNYPSRENPAKPEFPIIFLKPSTSVTGPGKPIWISPLTQNVAYEVELGLVVGKHARHVPPAEALQYLAGYLLANDVGDRSLEKRSSQWTSGKMFDSFTPLGPWLVTRDEITDPNALEMTALVNGEVVQHGSSAAMFFICAELVSMLSELTTLRPGDLILTGCPKMMDGLPNPQLALQPGDEVSVKIDGLGLLSNPVEKEIPCP